MSDPTQPSASPGPDFAAPDQPAAPLAPQTYPAAPPASPGAPGPLGTALPQPIPSQPVAGPGWLATGQPQDLWAPAGAPNPGPTAAPAPVPVEDTELVGRGLLFAVGGVLAGIVLTIAVWLMGFIASITTFALAWAAGFLYEKGAGSAPRKGALALLGLILLGVVGAMVGSIAADVWVAYSRTYPDAGVGELLQVVSIYVVDPQVWAESSTTLLMFVVFAALGCFGIVRNLFTGGRAQS